MERSEYDQWTINYLRGVGVEGALLDRVIRLVAEKDALAAELAARAPVKVGA